MTKKVFRGTKESIIKQIKKWLDDQFLADEDELFEVIVEVIED